MNSKKCDRPTGGCFHPYVVQSSAHNSNAMNSVLFTCLAPNFQAKGLGVPPGGPMPLEGHTRCPDNELQLDHSAEPKKNNPP